MLHMMPEITHSLEERAEEIQLECLPQLVVCAGFFLIYLVEELMGTLLGEQNKTDAETVHLGSVSVRRSDCCEDRDDRQISRWGTNTDPTQSYQTFSQHKTGELSLSSNHLPNGSYKNGGALRDFFTSKCI